MKRFISVMLSLMLVVTLLPPLQALANEDIPFDEYGFRTDVKEARAQLLATDGWEDFPAKEDVPLNKEWSINFSSIATPKKIEAMTIEHNGQEVPVTINYNNSEIVKVKPRSNLLGGQKHTLKILLTNGKKYKMDFTTAQRNIDVESNNNYSNAKEIYIGETFEGSLSASDEIDFYKIKIPRDGQLDVNIKGLAFNKISLYLYDEDGDDGDLLAYIDDQSVIRLSQELRAGDYYLRITGDGGYEVTTNFKPGLVNPEKALQDAQKAVDALPAPVDVTAEHSDRIKAATVLVAAAKALGADAVEIEILEAILEELQKVALPLEIASATVFNSTTFEIRFNRAVDASVALFEVKKGTTVKQAQVSFNANKTAVKVELNEKLTKGTYTMSVEGLVDGKLTATVDADNEQVESIEILSKQAVRIAGNQVSVPYKAENQYGEEMMDEIDVVIAVGDVVDGTASASKGIVKIPVKSDVKEGDSIVLELKANGKSAKETVTVSTLSSVMGITIQGIYNKDDKTLNETTDFDVDKFYLLIEARDQHGSKIDDVEIFKVPNTIRLYSEDSTIVKFGSITELQKIDGSLALELTGTPKQGETEVTLTAIASGNKDTYKVKVEESTRTDVVELQVPESIIANEEIFIPIKALDKEGKPIDDEKIITTPVSGIQYSITPYIPSEITTVGNEIGIKIKKEDNLVAGNFTIKAESSTKKSVTKTMIVKAKAAPATWEWDEDAVPSIQTEIEVKTLADHLSQDISKKVKVFDQYGKLVDNPFTSGYSLVITKENPSSEVVSVKGTTVKTEAVGTEKVTIGIKNGNQVVSGSEQTITFTVTDENNYIRYEVEPIGMVYDEVAAGKSDNPAYDKKVNVYGVNADLSTDLLTHGKHYTVTAVNNTLKKDLEKNGVLNIDTTDPTLQYGYQNANEIKAEVTVIMESTKEQHKQMITISKVAPYVKDLQLKEKGLETALKSISYSPADQQSDNERAFDFSKIVEVADLKVTDQYGQAGTLDETNYQFKFNDNTTIQGTLKFTKISGNLKFVKENTGEAAVTELPEGAEFTVTVSAGNQSSVPVKVTIMDGHTPETEGGQAAVDKEAEKIKALKTGPLATGDNVLTKANQLVGTGYTVTLKSSSNPDVIANNGKVTRPDLENIKVIVEFVVKSKDGLFKEIQVELLVLKAPTVDKTILETTLNRVNYAKVSSTEGSDIDPTEKWTTQAIRDTFDAAVTAAKSLNNKSNATQWEVTEGNGKLVAAIVAYEKEWQEGGFETSTNKETKNDMDTLNIVGTKVSSSDENIAMGTIVNGNIEISSVTAGAEGTVTLTVSGGPTNTNHATIQVTVAKDGTIIVVNVTKYNPVALTDVEATPGDTRATLAFTAPIGATSIKVQQSADGGGWTDSETAGLTVTSTRATVIGLANGTSYEFQLVVENGANAGESNVTNAVTPVAPLATAPTSIVLAVGSTTPVKGVTNVTIPAAGTTNNTGKVTGWVDEVANQVKFTVTDAVLATSTITINGEDYASGVDYAIAGVGILTIVITTTETGKIPAVRTFIVAISA